MSSEISMRSVDHAAELAGGYEALAARLGAPAERVIDWALGRARPDSASFLVVLDLIMQETRKLAREAAQQAVSKAQKSSKTA